MQTPKRKLGKYTNREIDPHVTEVKFRELKNKLEGLKKAQKPAIEEVKRLALMGDFSENAAYQIAKGRLRGINQGILNTEKILKKAIIIKTTDKEKIQIGHEIVIKIDGKIKKYLILGSSETNPDKNIISHNSPLGSQLINRKIGQKFKIKIANKEKECEILEIK